MRQALLLACLVATLGLPSAAEELLGERPSIQVPRVSRPPELEEFLDMQAPAELVGQLARVEGFVQQQPEDGLPASQRTHVYLGYDSTHFYAVFVAFDDETDRMRAHVSNRENVFGDETVEIQLDTYHDERRAFSFLANPFGVQWDAIWTEGQGFDMSWNTVWQSSGRITDKGYVVLMAIPFKSLRFSPNETQRWGVVLVRDIPRNNEVSFWPRVSNRIEGRLNQEATLLGLSGISPGRNLQIIPYATARNFDALENDSTPAFRSSDFDGNLGIDAKLVLRDSLAIDMTVNPDFSQVESDQPQVTVNQRFEVFFPERRPFFLENDSFFRTPLNLLFTRRIQDPRIGGRLTGKIGNWSLGTLLIDDEAPGEVLEPGSPGFGERAGVGVVRLSRDLARQSNIGVLLTDREFDDGHNRVGGVDGRFKLGDNWDTRFQAVHTRTRTVEGETLSDPAYSLEFNRNGRKLTTHSHYRQVGREFRAELGFVPRVDVRNLHQSVNYRFRPEGSALVAWGPSLFLERVEDEQGLRLDRRVNSGLRWEFRRQTEFGVNYDSAHERLRVEDFDALEQNTDYPTDNVRVNFSTRFVRSLSFSGFVSHGDSINFVPPAGQAPTRAERDSSSASMTLRPGKHLRLDANYLWTALDDRATGRQILVDRITRLRGNIQFDRKLSLRLILQWDNTDVDPDLTSLENAERFNADALLTYLVNPWTAVYVGYNTNYRNLELVGEGTPGAEVLRTTDDLLNDARQIFVKISYLFRP